MAVPIESTESSLAGKDVGLCTQAHARCPCHRWGGGEAAAPYAQNKAGFPALGRKEHRRLLTLSNVAATRSHDACLLRAHVTQIIGDAFSSDW